MLARLSRAARLASRNVPRRPLAASAPTAASIRASSSITKLAEARKDADLFVRHRPAMCLYDLKVDLEINSFLAPSASVSGSVEGGDNVSVWYGAVVKGDQSHVKLGAYVSIGDKSVVNTVSSVDTGFSAECTVGNFVIIGPGCCLTSCTVGDFVQIGAGSVVSEGSFVEKGAQLAPGSVVPPGRVVPAGERWGGNPVHFQAKLGADDAEEVRAAAVAQHDLAMAHFDEFNPQGQAYRTVEAWADAGRPLTPEYRSD